MKERTKEEIYKDIEKDLPDIPGEPFLTPAAVHKAFEYRWRSSSGVFIHDTLPEMYDMWKSCTFNEYVKMWEEQLLKGGAEERLEWGRNFYVNLNTDKIFLLSHATGSKENISVRNAYLRQAIMFAVSAHQVRQAMVNSGVMLPKDIANHNPFPWYRFDFNLILKMLYPTDGSKPVEFSDRIFAQMDKVDMDIAWEQYCEKKGIEIPETSTAKAEVVVKDEEASVEDAPEGLAGKFSGAAWKNVHMKFEIIGGSRKKKWRLKIKHSDDKEFETYYLDDPALKNGFMYQGKIKKTFHALRQFSLYGGFLSPEQIVLTDDDGKEIQWEAFKMQLSRLRDDLQKIFGIKEDPIDYMSDGAYALLFGSITMADAKLKESMRDFIDDGRDAKALSGEARIVSLANNFDRIADAAQTDAGLSSTEKQQWHTIDSDYKTPVEMTDDEDLLFNYDSDDEESDYDQS